MGVSLDVLALRLAGVEGRIIFTEAGFTAPDASSSIIKLAVSERSVTNEVRDCPAGLLRSPGGDHRKTVGSNV
jgi:hypothetical protein